MATDITNVALYLLHLYNFVLIYSIVKTDYERQI